MGRVGMKYNKKPKIVPNTLAKTPKRRSVPALRCQCVHYDPLECQAIRFQAASTMIRILNDGSGCSCDCHYTLSNALVSHNVWTAMAEARQRRSQRSEVG